MTKPLSLLHQKRGTAGAVGNGSSSSSNNKPRLYLVVSIAVITLLSQSILLEDYYYGYYYYNCGDSSKEPRNSQSSRSSLLRLENGSGGGSDGGSNKNQQQLFCPDLRSSRTATPSESPKVPLHNQRQFALGGYNLIARGSGEVCLAGPILNLISRLQHSNDRRVFGTVAELGVHHGRFTGFLFVTSRSTEKLVVGDLFEELQSENVDKSGLGDRRRFLKGLTTYGLDERDLSALYTGSTDRLPLDWSRTAGFEPFRLISVDAGHTAELTLNDLQVAFCNLLNGGVVVLDDWFHSTWPGVVEGFYQFVHSSSSSSSSSSQSRVTTDDVYPFLVCESKLYVTNDKEYHELYYQSLLSDPELSKWLTPYAHEKERGKLLYEMNGVNYLKCKSRQNITTSEIQEVWSDRVY